MKKITFSTLALLSLLLAGCKKDDDNKPATSTQTASGPATKGSFSWKFGSGTTVTADSAYYYASFTTILAFKAGLVNSVEINLSALTAGSYSLSSVTGNNLTYVSSANSYSADAGSCIISSAASNSLSGSFSATLTGGGATSAFTGSFAGLAQR